MPVDGPTPAEIAALTKSLEDLRNEREAQLKLRKEMASAADIEINTLKTEIELLTEQAMTARNNAIMLAELQANAKDDEEAYRTELQLKVEALKEADDKTGKYADQIRILNDILNDTTANTKDLVEKFKKEQQQALRTSKAILNLKKNTEGLSNATSGLLGDLTGMTLQLGKKGFGGALAKALTEGASFKNLLGDMGEKLLDLNIVGNIFANTFNNAWELADYEAGIRQATGAGEEMNEVFIESYKSTLLLGRKAVEVAGNTKALAQEFIGFTNLSGDAQRRLTSLTSTLDLYGISSSDVAATQDILQMSLQMSAEEAESTQMELVSLAKALKVPPSIITKDFKTAQNVIGQFGKEGINVFKGLSAQVKATGIEMSSLIGIAEQFDTFESAAEHVGSLNAIMGGDYFDTMTMVAATEDERIALLKQGVAAMGKSWESMGRFERKSIMAAAGIRDMTEANKMFGSSLESVNARQIEAFNAGKMGWDDLTEGAKGAMGATDKWNAILGRMALIIQPVIDGLMEFLDGLLGFLEIATPVFEFFEGIIGFFMGVLKPVFLATGALLGLVGAFKALKFITMMLVKSGPIGWLITGLTLVYELMKAIGLTTDDTSSSLQNLKPPAWLPGSKAATPATPTAVGTPGIPGGAISTASQGASVSRHQQIAMAAASAPAPSPAVTSPAFGGDVVVQLNGNEIARLSKDAVREQIRGYS